MVRLGDDASSVSGRPLVHHASDPVCALRREHPGWGPQTRHRLGQEDVSSRPSRSAVYRALVRHGLIEPSNRRRQRSDYKRWERSRPMALWQMDVVGGVKLADGGEASIVTGLDDHSRFCVSAKVVAPDPQGRTAAAG